MPNLETEKLTLARMIAIYCHGKHGSRKNLCAECAELEAYAAERVTRCVHGRSKPICAKCPVHCYKPVMRERIKDVMRYAGPRMLLRHPLLAMRHLLAGLCLKPQS